MNTGARKKNLKIIVCAAIVLAALFAAAWLFLDRAETVYDGVTPPVKILSTDGGDLFDVSPLGAKVNSHSVGVCLDIRSRAEGRYFTLGEALWTNGVCSSATSSDRLGYAERFENGGWEYCCDVVDIAGRTLFDTSTVLRLIRPSDEQPEPTAVRIPMHDPGRYRVFLEVRDYFPAGGGDALDAHGSSGDVSYTVGFEYNVPATDAAQPQVAAVEIRPVQSSENAAHLNFAVKYDKDVSALSVENVSIERAGIFAGCSAKTSGGAELQFTPFDDPSGISVSIASDPADGGSGQIFCIWGTVITDAEPNAVYRLSVDFTAEAPNGSRTGYTVRFLVRTPE